MNGKENTTNPLEIAALTVRPVHTRMEGSEGNGTLTSVWG